MSGTMTRISTASVETLPELIRVMGDAELFTERLARQEEGRGKLFIAWRDEAPVGVVYLWLEQAEEQDLRDGLPDVPLLVHFKVDPDHRNQGIGTKLVDAAEREAGKQGRPRVALSVDASNRDAIRLYERLCYKLWRKEPLVTRSVTYHSDGTSKSEVEYGLVFVKDLPKQDAGDGAQSLLRRTDPTHRRATGKGL